MEKLIKGQQELFDQLIKAERNFKKANQEARAKYSYLVARMEALEKLEEVFSQNHLEIITKATEEHLKVLKYFKDDMQDQFQELFIQYKSILKEYIALAKPLSGTSSMDTRESSSANSKLINSEVQLPRIQLPHFSGKYTEWQSFYDMFLSLIHENNTLSPVQKLHYLKSSLSGEPEMLLRNFPTTSANYKEAWEQLSKRYNNKKYNCNAIMKTLFGQKLILHESTNALKHLLDTTTSCLKALNNLNISTDQWDPVIIHLVVSKLDHESLRQWETYVSSTTDDLPKWSQLEQFIETRFRTLELLETGKQMSKTMIQSRSSHQPVKTKSFHTALEVKNASPEATCAMCNGPHFVYHCAQFKKQPILKRQNIAQAKRLCFNCLAPTHSVYKCHQNTSCHKCGKKHHTLLHFEKEDKEAYYTLRQTEQNKGEPEQRERETTSETNVVANFSRGDIKTYNVLLATAVVKSKSKNGCFVIRALLDQGSQASFVSEHIVQLLGLKRTNVNGKVSCLGDGHLNIKHAVNVEIESRYEPVGKVCVNAYVLKSLTSLLPSREVRIPDWLELKSLPLADPEFSSPGKVDILLGADVYGEILQNGVKKSPRGNLLAQNTLFGWVLSGKIEQESVKENVLNLHVQVKEDELLKKFWEIENEPNSIEKRLTEEEKLCEKLYEETTLRREDGKFVVKLPFKTNNPQCQYGQSCDIAINKLLSLEKRLSKNPTLSNEYNRVLEEYTTLNHMKQVPNDDIDNPKCVYLPHHAVVREDKQTTKVRVVFNASNKGVNNVSLNDDLMIGPKLQQDLRHLLLRWRKHPIAIIADIVKMYRQVFVHEDDTNFQRILWRSNDKVPIQHFKLLTLTFGTACAPYLAVKTLQTLALLEKDKFPVAAHITKNDYYVDDLMTGCETETEALQIYEEMTELMNTGGFEMQKWSSNSQRFVNYIEQNKVSTVKSLTIESDGMMKVLGIKWNRLTDNFEYVVNLTDTKEPITKRTVLSDIARLYDPIGWISPVVITAKIFIQKLWKEHLEWDDKLPKKLLLEWLHYKDELRNIKNILIPRWLGCTKKCKLELHAFSDASHMAYAAVVYLRVIDEHNNVYVNLVTAKTKVAPIEKEVSIPRLELCGATLAAKLLHEVSQVMEIPKSDMFAWTDSTVVLAWLRGPVNRWVTYVSNRVSHILTIMNFEQWAHVPTNVNPADCASRGLKPMALNNYDLWWHGPDFLSEFNIKVTKPEVIDTNEEERVKSFMVMEKQVTFEWVKFSELNKLLRVISLCRRFLKVRLPFEKRKEFSKVVTPDEIEQSLKLCIKQAQEYEFEEEIRSLKTKGCVAKRSLLYTLCPFLDINGIIRVGGRLSQSEVSYDQKHPIILPAKNHLSQLIVANAHVKTLHGGPQLMMNYLRSKFWILRAREMVKKYYQSCVVCLRYSKAAATQLMGQLPEARLKPSRPFKTSGVDYAGPINIRFSPGRGAKSYKGYICLFVCMVTRAVHLEAVSDLTAKGFIAAFRRFISRRGHCSDLYSDNGTNFVGANAMFSNMFKGAKSELSHEMERGCKGAQTTPWRSKPTSPARGASCRSANEALATD
ncbi:uncharacterized protein LOC125073870 [Vanessa atalanta]|uniref:uncharacterized protein LOC125073870 n=1 Tax=Vanessa atalanta TaxID=42275 RepID=UPI001FCD78D5|nr:uncharacterized protein LOC125073870 [Vanessa atalanta]